MGFSCDQLPLMVNGELSFFLGFLRAGLWGSAYDGAIFPRGGEIRGVLAGAGVSPGGPTPALAGACQGTLQPQLRRQARPDQSRMTFRQSVSVR